MRIYTRAGDLAFKVFSFPDGQPHFKLETYERDFNVATVEVAIKSPTDLFTLALVRNVLSQQGFGEVNLDIRYLMGARMDRAIDTLQPHTLEVVAKQINSLGFTKVRFLDVHSETATRLIRNSTNLLPRSIVKGVYTTLGNRVITVCPDKGATDRVNSLANSYVVQCEKLRDPNTGALSGFKVKEYFPPADSDQALIVDDICDGGGTFVGLAKELRKAGAKKVFLFVTHGIFSKGLPLEGIDKVFTTDSFEGSEKYNQRSLVTTDYDNLVVIPIRMSDL